MLMPLIRRALSSAHRAISVTSTRCAAYRGRADGVHACDNFRTDEPRQTHPSGCTGGRAGGEVGRHERDLHHNAERVAGELPPQWSNVYATVGCKELKTWGNRQLSPVIIDQIDRVHGPIRYNSASSKPLKSGRTCAAPTTRRATTAIKFTVAIGARLLQSTCPTVGRVTRNVLDRNCFRPYRLSSDI